MLLRANPTLLSALFLVALVSYPAAQGKEPDPARYTAEIQAFQQWDTKNAAPANGVLFVGSSTIRLWPTADRFPGVPVINRGFGGSHISEVNHFIGEVVLRYAPDVIVFYAGDNDINDGKTPERVLSDYQAFVSRVQAAKSTTRIVFLALKPSVARWKLWPTMKHTNELVQKWSTSRPTLHFLDVATPMLGADAQPRPSLFVADGLHMSPEGYDLWTRLLAPVIVSAR